MHSWLRKKYIELDKRVRAGFTPLPPKTIMQTSEGSLWPHDCSCQPRNTIEPRYDGNVDPAFASLPRLGAAVTTLQRALSLKTIRILVKAATGHYNTFRGLSLGRESALSCITVGDVLRLYDGRRWGAGDKLLGTMLCLPTRDQASASTDAHLDAPLITYIREEESRVEYTQPVCNAQWCCAIRSAARWTEPTVGNLHPEDSEVAEAGPGFLREVPASVARRIQEAGLPLPTDRFVLRDEFILWKSREQWVVGVSKFRPEGTTIWTTFDN